MVGWHHRLSGHEFEYAPGVYDGQGSLVCCSPWGCKESDMTEQPILSFKQIKKIFKVTSCLIPFLQRSSVWFSSVQPLSHVQLFVTPWTAARQASLSITNSWSVLKLMSIESVMSSNHLILCHPLFFLPSVFPSIRVFSYESVLRIR